MKNGLVRVMLMLVTALLLGGCAIGQKISYNDTGLELKAAGNIQVAVASQDSRPYIKDGEKDRSYVGKMRGGFGNPFNVNTESGKPLADDMSSVICSSLKQKGFSCTPVSVELNESPSQITNKLQATNAKRLILMTFSEWLSDTYHLTYLHYDIALTVMDNKGLKLAEKKVAGEDKTEGSHFNPFAIAKENVPKLYKNKLELLLNDDAVVNALK
jgi:hypothetical protein